MDAEVLEVLQFYADPENWKEQESGIGMYPGEAVMDCGKRAQDALKKIGGRANGKPNSL